MVLCSGLALLFPLGPEVVVLGSGASAVDDFEDAARRHARSDDAPGFVHAAEDQATVNP